MSDNGGNAELLHVCSFDTVCRVVLVKAWDSETEATNGRSSVPRHLARGAVLPGQGIRPREHRAVPRRVAHQAAIAPLKTAFGRGDFLGKIT